MELFKNKWFNIFRLARVIFYVAFFATFLIIPTSYFIENPAFCFFKSNYNFLCPTCGVTRAFSSLMHFNFKQAYFFNPVFTISFGPIFMFLFIEDFIKITLNFFKKDYKYSIIEFIVFKCV